MAVAAAIGGVFIDHVTGLIVCIIAIGFFTGFYLVPLFSLQQHRAAKRARAMSIATNNLVNVIGAISASAAVLRRRVRFSQSSARHIRFRGSRDGISRLAHRAQSEEGRTSYVVIQDYDENHLIILPLRGREQSTVIDLTPSVPATFEDDQCPNVVVAHYKLRGVDHYLVRMAEEKVAPVFDTAHLPRYLFFGAGVMALIALGLLWHRVARFVQPHGMGASKPDAPGANESHARDRHEPCASSAAPSCSRPIAERRRECRNVISATDPSRETGPVEAERAGAHRSVADTQPTERCSP